MSIVAICVNGIFTEPGSESGWVRRAVTWININRPYKADAFEYFSMTVDRNAMQGWRAAKLVKKMRFYLDAGFDIKLVAHSNGADVVLDALRELDYPTVYDIHLFSPAVAEDCDANGINSVKARAVHIYRGGKDWAMDVADTWIGRARGFGALGKHGPKNLRDGAPPVHIVDERSFGHSTWFDEEQFPLTMHRACPPEV